MIEFPAIWIRYVLIGIGALLLFISVMHLKNALSHGGRGLGNMISSGLFIIGLVAIVWLANDMLSQIDWQTNFSLDLPNLPFINLPK